jgi:hypothetical protein
MLNMNPLAGLVGFLLVAAILGGLAFLGFSHTDLANFNISAAQARAMDKQTELNAQKSEIDMSIYKDVEQAQGEAEKEKVQLDLNTQKEQASLLLDQMKASQQQQMQKQQALDQVQIEFEHLVSYTALIIFILVAISISIGLTVLMVQFAKFRFSVKQSDSMNLSNGAHRDMTDLWHDDLNWRETQVTQARKREQAVRASTIHFRNDEQSLDYTKLFLNNYSDINEQKR